jgi:outer membrane protein TolC
LGFVHVAFPSLLVDRLNRMKYSQSLACITLSAVATVLATVAHAQAQSVQATPPVVTPGGATSGAPAALPVIPAQPIVPAKPATLTPATALPPTTPAKPIPTLPIAPAAPAPTAPVSPQPVPGTSLTKVDGLKRKVPVPETLNPNPNPLQRPTQPSEVQLKGAERVTLEQAIELAERNNRTIEQAKLQLEVSRATLREAEAARNPSIFVQGNIVNSTSAGSKISGRQQLDTLNNNLNSSDFTTRFQAQQSEVATRRSINAATAPTTDLSTSLNLNYNLFTAGARSGQIKAAERLVRVSELEVDRVTAQTRFDVADSYYQVQDAEEQIKISQAAIASSESSLRDTQAQFDAGLGTKFDVLRVQVQLANNRQQLTSGIANREIQRRRLAQRLSLPETLIVVPAEDKPQKVGEWPLGLEQTIVLAYKNRAELEEQLVQREISDARRKVALAALGPTVSLAAQLNFLDILERSGGIGNGYSISAQARWTLFDGGAAQAQADQQTKNQQIAESRFAEQRNTVRFEVEQAYATMLSNRESIETTRLAIAQAEEAEKLATLRFQAGVGTQTEKIDALSDLTRARGNNVSAVIGFNRALAQLRRSVSNLPSDLSQIGRVAAK